jgi:hypothetical protein
LKSLCNYGARHDNTDTEGSRAESDDDEGKEEEPIVPKKGTRILAQYVLVKLWVTGERAEIDEEDIEKELQLS